MTTRILIVDDVAELRQIFRMMLESDERFEVVGEAADGAEAIELCRAHQPDVIVLDLAMPVLDGLQAIPEIKAQSPQTAIVVLSGFARGQLDAQALAMGARAYVEKSEAFEKLAATLVHVTATDTAA